MKLTSEDLAKLQTKQVANIIRKLGAGKTLTAREEAILAKSRTTEEGDFQTSGNTPSGYAKTWQELADACHVDRRTLQNASKNFGKKCPKPRADGRHEIAAWIRFLDEHDIKGRGENNPEIAFLDERQLRLEERKLRVERERFELKKVKAEMVHVAHIEAALGTMLAHFRQTLDSLPSRISQGVEESDHTELLALLVRAEKQKLPYKKLRALIEKGKVHPFADIHARRAFVQSEIDLLQKNLAACEYLEADPGADEEE